MSHSIPAQLRFPPFAGFTVRADFEGGALSSDFGPLLLRDVDQQIGLIHRLAQALVEQVVASYAKPPETIMLDMDHSEDRVHGQQELAFYNHHYQSHCHLPLFLFEGLSGRFITAALRPGKRPKGAENAMILKRVLKRVRQYWPETRILLRGDAHFANVELMQLALDDPYTDFLFGLTGNSRLKKRAEPHLKSTRQLHDTRCHNAHLAKHRPPHRSRTFHELDYQAHSWPQAFRTALKAEVPVPALPATPRFLQRALSSNRRRCQWVPANVRPEVDVDPSGLGIVGGEVQIAKIGNAGHGIEQTHKANGDLLRPGYALLFEGGGQRTAFVLNFPANEMAGSGRATAEAENVKQEFVDGVTSSGESSGDSSNKPSSINAPS